MTHTSNRIMDEFAKLMNDAAGVAQGVRREIDTVVKAQAERLIADMDLVKREEFDALKAMVVKAREENARLEKMISDLESKIPIKMPARKATPKTARTRTKKSGDT
jgi:BMFP domain-containing protein YqiC